MRSCATAQSRHRDDEVLIIPSSMSVSLRQYTRQQAVADCKDGLPGFCPFARLLTAFPLDLQ